MLNQIEENEKKKEENDLEIYIDCSKTMRDMLNYIEKDTVTIDFHSEKEKVIAHIASYEQSLTRSPIREKEQGKSGVWGRLSSSISKIYPWKK